MESFVAVDARKNGSINDRSNGGSGGKGEVELRATIHFMDGMDRTDVRRWWRKQKMECESVI